MAKTEQTQAVFTRLTAADLKTLRAIAKRQDTTTSMLVRGLTEAFIERERAKQKRDREAAKALRAHETAVA